MSQNSIKKYQLHNYEILDSTSLEAKRLIKNNIIGNHIIWAWKQTNGYGKLSRKWESGDQDISFSLIVEHQYSETIICQLLFVAAISVRKSIDQIFKENKIQAKIEVKWPNDIMVDGRKICGILIENLQSPDGRSFAVVGVGVNITYNLADPDLLTSSLNQYNICDVERLELIQDIVDNFESYKRMWSKYGFAPIRKFWIENAYNIGARITTKNSESKITGIFAGIDDSGALNLLMESGLTIPISIEEIFFNK